YFNVDQITENFAVDIMVAGHDRITNLAQASAGFMPANSVIRHLPDTKQLAVLLNHLPAHLNHFRINSDEGMTRRVGIPSPPTAGGLGAGAGGAGCGVAVGGGTGVGFWTGTSGCGGSTTGAARGGTGVEVGGTSTEATWSPG